MRQPPSNRSLVLSVLGTALCLGIIYWAVASGERSKAAKPTAPVSATAPGTIADAGPHD